MRNRAKKFHFKNKTQKCEQYAFFKNYINNMKNNYF